MTIVIIAEQQGNTALELTFKARTIAPEARIIVLCEEGNEADFGSAGADEQLLIPALEDDCAQAERLADALAQIGPDAALFPATVRGRFLSAWAAARLDTGLTADCTELCITDDGLLKQIRPAFGGNLTAEILCRTHRPQLASVRPGVFPLPAKQPERILVQKHISLADVKTYLRKIAFRPVQSEVSLQNAEVIVTGGKGVGSAKAFEKLEKLAGLLGGAVGATRSAVDAGWISYAHQIGQTGVNVQPRLYIAFGVSGFVQHTVGMNSSEIVVAVNTDRNAPIFSCADYGIVADWEETIDAMIQFLQNQKEA
ncbi:MAG: electron transfer flavoprotein subunit alpha/FixB family protein [bacterium]|nr:electron transfer flavoprotein subunit alpha/FixB family protein [bacterium]